MNYYPTSLPLLTSSGLALGVNCTKMIMVGFDGKTKWEKSWDDAEYMSVYSIDGIILVHTQHYRGSYSKNPFSNELVAYDEDGNELWDEELPSSEPGCSGLVIVDDKMYYYNSMGQILICELEYDESSHPRTGSSDLWLLYGMLGILTVIAVVAVLCVIYFPKARKGGKG